jgi:hypothetical protein
MMPSSRATRTALRSLSRHRALATYQLPFHAVPLKTDPRPVPELDQGQRPGASSRARKSRLARTAHRADGESAAGCRCFSRPPPTGA